MSPDLTTKDLQRCVTVLGDGVTAALCGDVRPAAVRGWLAGVGGPSPAQRDAIHCARLTLDVFAPAAADSEVKAWFVATNPHLSESPVEALRHGAGDRVLAAADTAL